MLLLNRQAIDNRYVKRSKHLIKTSNITATTPSGPEDGPSFMDTQTGTEAEVTIIE
jgi:hypothetical protein